MFVLIYSMTTNAQEIRRGFNPATYQQNVDPSWNVKYLTVPGSLITIDQMNRYQMKIHFLNEKRTSFSNINSACVSDAD